MSYPCWIKLSNHRRLKSCSAGDDKSLDFLRRRPRKRLLFYVPSLLDDSIQFSAEDPTAVGYNAMGGVGCVSVTANVAPAACAKLQEACLAGDYAEALKWQDRLLPLHSAVFIESSPAPTKYALSLLGKCTEEVRMPICPVTEESRAVIRAAMVHAGVLN